MFRERSVHRNCDHRTPTVYFTQKRWLESTSPVKEQLVEYSFPVPGMDYQNTALSESSIPIVYFTRKKCWDFTSSVKEQLVEYGFPVPGMDYQRHSCL